MPKLSGEIATELLGRVSEVALVHDVVAIGVQLFPNRMVDDVGASCTNEWLGARGSSSGVVTIIPRPWSQDSWLLSLLRWRVHARHNLGMCGNPRTELVISANWG